MSDSRSRRGKSRREEVKDIRDERLEGKAKYAINCNKSRQSVEDN